MTSNRMRSIKENSNIKLEDLSSTLPKCSAPLKNKRPSIARMGNSFRVQSKTTKNTPISSPMRGA